MESSTPKRKITTRLPNEEICNTLDTLDGQGIRTEHSAIVMPGATVPADAVLGRLVRIKDGATVGRRCRIGDFVTLPDWVVLEDEVEIGSGVVFVERVEPYGERYVGQEVKTITTIMKGAAIGANSVIQRGVTIGCYAWICAGSVIHKDVIDYRGVHGSPAVESAYVCLCGRALRLYGHGTAEGTHCTHCARHYALIKGFVHQQDLAGRKRMKEILTRTDKNRTFIRS